MDSIEKTELFIEFSIWSACNWLFILKSFAVTPGILNNFPEYELLFDKKLAFIFQYSSGLNAFISSSLSFTMLTATDCTLPTDNRFNLSKEEVKPLKVNPTTYLQVFFLYEHLLDSY